MSVPQTVKNALALIQAYIETLETPPPTPDNTLAPPYVITTGMSIFGLNWDGSNDTGDLNPDGSNATGAWGAVTHNDTTIGCALPILVLKGTLGGLDVSHIKGNTVGVYSQ